MYIYIHTHVTHDVHDRHDYIYISQKIGVSIYIYIQEIKNATIFFVGHMRCFSSCRPWDQKTGPASLSAQRHPAGRVEGRGYHQRMSGRNSRKL